MSLNIQLDARLASFVEEQLERGSYGDANAVVEAGLRLLEAEEQSRKAKFENLKSLIAEGMDDEGDLPAEQVFQRLSAKYQAMSDAKTEAERDTTT